MMAAGTVSSASEEEVEYKHLDLAELIGTPPTRTQSRRVQGIGAPNLHSLAVLGCSRTGAAPPVRLGNFVSEVCCSRCLLSPGWWTSSAQGSRLRPVTFLPRMSGLLFPYVALAVWKPA